MAFPRAFPTGLSTAAAAASPDPLAALAGLHVADLYLAYGCGSGDSAAIETL